MNDGNIRGAVSQDQRRGDVSRHIFQHDQRAACQLRYGPADIRPFRQINLLNADAVVAVGFDPVVVVHERRELALVQRDDAVLHVRRTHPGIGPHHADDGDIDFRKDVRRHAQRRPDAQKADQHNHRRDGVRTIEGKTHERHKTPHNSHGNANVSLAVEPNLMGDQPTEFGDDFKDLYV